jgi:hypothetical protein
MERGRLLSEDAVQGAERTTIKILQVVQLSSAAVDATFVIWSSVS